jgi:hypothetical protein
MKLFKCDHCGQLVNFENYSCLNCHASLGFDPQRMEMISLETSSDGLTLIRKQQSADPDENSFRYCLNQQHLVCNWLLPAISTSSYCVACNLNRTIPDLQQPDSWEKWSRIEIAKHRLIYSLLRFHLPVVSKFQDEVYGLAFDFKTDQGYFGPQRLVTGHKEGLITLNIEEADDAIREMARNQMGEVYRTILGHFRHEIGHYYWDRLIRDPGQLAAFRNCFGDESIDYAAALRQYHGSQRPNNWSTSFISAYSSAHPWEDWAETWAHYMHIVDTMETAYSFGLEVNPRIARKEDKLESRMNVDPYTIADFEEIFQRWIPLALTMNGLNRSMGMNDSYPFVITGAVKKKLAFVHETIKSGQQLQVPT